MPQRAKIKAIVDTNLWISFLLTKDFSKLDFLVKRKRFVFLFSEELLEEFLAVTQRRKFRNYFTNDDVNFLLLTIRKHALFIKVTDAVKVCRDEKDDFLLALAKAGKATHLITGDKDLLVLKSFGKTKIITLTHFLKEEFKL